MLEFMNTLGRESFIKVFADSPANLAFVEARFKGADQEVCDTFLEYVDDSAFSLRDWIDALRCLGHWLDARSLTMQLEDQIGYVSCASMAVDVSANLTHLPSLVDDMLETYGCERAVEK